MTALPDATGRILAVLDAILDHEFFARGQDGAPAGPGPVDSAESRLVGGSACPKASLTMAKRRLHALLELVEAGVAKLADGSVVVHEGGWILTFDARTGLTMLSNPAGTSVIVTPSSEPVIVRGHDTAA